MRLVSIQYLRGVAAILIVIYHAFVQLERFGLNTPAPQILSAGVDIFFVISGYIIWYTTFNKQIDQAAFLRHRITRIVPLYWTITTVYLVVLLAKPGWMQGAKYSLFHILASYLFIATPHPTHPLMMWPLLVAGWSLNVEMLFYFLFSFGLAFSAKARLISLEIVLFVLVGLHYAINPPMNSAMAFYTSSIMLEFGFGLGLGYVCSKEPSIGPLSAVALFLSGIISFIAVASFDLLPEVQGVSYGLPSLLIVAGAVFYERSKPVPRLRIAELLGDSSYSLYLTHGAVLSCLAQAWQHIVQSTEASNLMNMIIFTIVGLALAALIGVLTYKTVEVPLLRTLSRKVVFPERNEALT